MKKMIPIAVVVVIAAGAWLLFKNGKNPLSTSGGSGDEISLDRGEGRIHFKVKELEPGVVAQSGPYKISKNEINSSAAMRAFNNNEKDLLFVLVYKQFVSYAEKPASQIDFSIDRTSLSPKSLVTQFKLEFNNQTKLNFGAFDSSEGLARVDGKLVSRSEVDFNNFIWATHESDIFRYKLRDVDKRIKSKVVEAEAQKLNIVPKQYRERYIFNKLPMEVSEKDILAYMKKYQMDDSPRNRANAQTRLLDMRKRRGVDYILERYVMDLPILIDLDAPSYRLEVKDEWTPGLGNTSGDLKITLFGDTRKGTSAAILQGLLPLLKKFDQAGFYYRPVYSEKDGTQATITKAHLCIWKQETSKFWKFFNATLGSLGSDPKKKMMAEASSVGVNQKKLKECLGNAEMNKVLKYHLDYAKYLGIEAGPVLYVGGEVFSGNINLDEVEKSIRRNLNIPTAGIW